MRDIMKQIVLAFLLMIGIASSACINYLYPQPMVNASGVINSTPIPAVSYTYRFYDGNGTTYLTTTTNNSSVLYTVPSSYNFTRIYVSTNNSTWGTCTNYTLVMNTVQKTQSTNLFANTIGDWFNAYASLIVGLLSAGIAYGITAKIGHAALATSIMWAVGFIIFANPIFFYGAMVALIAGLVLTYANV